MNKSRLVFLLLALLMCVPCVSWADETDPVSGLNYVVNGDEVTITKNSNKNLPADLVIPSTIQGLPVTVIESYAFSRVSISSVTIPATIKIIKEGAFETSLLKTINFTEDSQLETIESAAFDGTAITEITIPASVKKLAGLALCEKLETVTFEEGSQLEVIYYDTFSGDILLKQINIPSGINTIGENSFCSTAITSINIPANVNTIGPNVLAYCEDLETVTFNYTGDLRNYDSEAFGSDEEAIEYLTSLKAIYVPKGTMEAYTAKFPLVAKFIKEIDDAPTGIHTANAAASSASASNSAVYTLDGKLVSKNGNAAGLTKGIYVQNGKKVMLDK